MDKVNAKLSDVLDITKRTFVVEGFRKPYFYSEKWFEKDGKKQCERKTVAENEGKLMYLDYVDSKPVFEEIKDRKLDRDFFKEFKKKFDLTVKFDKPVTIKRWNGETKEVEEVESRDVVLRKVSNFHIQEIMKILEIVDDVPMVNGYPKRDWEDEYMETLMGKYIKVIKTGQGMDTKYSWKEGKDFEVKIDEIPF